MDDEEIIKEFLIESAEGLTRLEQEIVDLEKRPNDPQLLGSIFRTIHSMKGTCGFLGFSNLERVTHIAENLLSQLRNGERSLSTELISLILETMDAVKAELASIESTLRESGETYDDLRRKLEIACNAPAADATPAVPAPKAAASPAPSPILTPAPSPKLTPAPSPILTPVPPPAAAVEVPKPQVAESTPKFVAPVVEAQPAKVQVEENNHDAHPSAAADVDKGTAGKGASLADSTIRVDVGQLDKVMNLVGELVLARNQILQFTTRQDDTSLNATAQRLNLITTQLQEGVMKTRMQPIGVVWNKLPRVVRDLATSCGKQIQLELDGAETELDKSIIESIKDPLTHIVRNCCDHGIETPADRVKNGKPAQGRLLLRAYHEGGQVNIEITDDGRGIDVTRVKRKAVEKGLLRQEQVDRLGDREAANLVFLPGFSTAEQVTNISGRGVGMDVVKTNIEKIGGVVDLVSQMGHGTTVKIKIPLTLAIIPGLVIMSGGERFIIPQVSLLELVRLEGDAIKKQIEMIHDTPVYRRRGSLLPIAYLNRVLRLSSAHGDSEVLNMVVLQSEDRQFGLVVDAIHDTQEIVVKPLGKQLKGLPAFAGATIMGDGGVALILDVLGIGRLSGVVSEPRDQARLNAQKSDAAHQNRQTFLLFRSGSYGRLAVPLSLVARLEEFPHDRVERGSGQLVVQYRDQILPLIPLSNILEDREESLSSFCNPAQVIVFAEENRMVGVIVDEILDIHSEAIRTVKKSNGVGLSGSGVVGGKVTDFLDLPAILRRTQSAWNEEDSQQGSAVLVVDRRSFSPGLIRNYLELANHTVIEAVDQQDAMEKLANHTIQAAVLSNSLPGNGAEKLIEFIRSRPNLANIHAVVLCDTTKEMNSKPAASRDIYVERFDRSGLIASLEHLPTAVEDSRNSNQGLSMAGSAK